MGNRGAGKQRSEGDGERGSGGAGEQRDCNMIEYWSGYVVVGMLAGRCRNG